MPGWLEKAKESLSRQAVPGPEPFSVGCDCGKIVQGERQDEAQQVRCAGCGDPVFVLPRNVYPVPKAKPAKQKKSKAKKRQEKVVSIPWHTIAQNYLTRCQNWLLLRFRFLTRRIIRFFTPFRMIFIAIVLLVSATTFWTLRIQAIERAGTVYLQASRDGLQAIANSEIIVAEQKLAEAIAALDLLKHNDEEAKTLRQRYREVLTINNLLGDSLADVVEDAKQTIQSGADWQDAFARRYQNKWIVLETEVAAGDQPGKYKLDYPMLLAEEQLNIQGAFTLLHNIPGDRLEEDGRIDMIVAVQLQSCDRSKTNSINWVITVQPDSAHLWSGFKTYSALGYNIEPANPLAEPTRKLLKQQSAHMGVLP